VLRLGVGYVGGVEELKWDVCSQAGPAVSVGS
jgi:hypothetical protein